MDRQDRQDRQDRRDRRTVAIGAALVTCALVYVVGILLIVGLTAWLGMPYDVARLLESAVLLVAAMAAIVILLRDQSRRT